MTVAAARLGLKNHVCAYAKRSSREHLETLDPLHYYLCFKAPEREMQEDPIEVLDYLMKLSRSVGWVKSGRPTIGVGNVISIGDSLYLIVLTAVSGSDARTSSIWPGVSITPITRRQ